MEQLHFRYYQPKRLVTFILLTGTIVSLGVSWLIKLMELTGGSYYQFPTAGAIVLLIISFIDNRFWKSKLFNWLYWVPNLGGRYKGEIRFIHPITKEKSSKKCAIEVIQTGSKIKVNSYFEDEDKTEKSPSRSLVESIVKMEDDNYSIVFTYQNDGIQGLYPPHTGTNILKWIKNGDGVFLKGIYYTNRQPQTKGDLEVKFITETLNNDY